MSGRYPAMEALTSPLIVIVRPPRDGLPGMVESFGSSYDIEGEGVLARILYDIADSVVDSDSIVHSAP